MRPWLDTFNQDSFFKQHDFPMSASVHIKYSSCDCYQTTNPIRFCLDFFYSLNELNGHWIILGYFNLLQRRAMYLKKGKIFKLD